MKILCISDAIDPLIYSNNAKKNFPDVDLILCAGDLPMDYVEFVVSIFNKPTYFIFGNHNLSDFKYFHQPHSNTVVHNFQPNNLSHEISRGAVYTGFKTLEIEEIKIPHPKTKAKTPLLIAGASGSFNYNNGLNQYSDSQMKRKLLFLIPKLILNKIRYGRYLDIFLTHATPYKIHDKEDLCHRGFECFNWFIKKFSPKYMIHGHIHIYDQREERISQFEQTTIVNAYAHYVLDFENLSEITKKQSVSEENLKESTDEQQS